MKTEMLKLIEILSSTSRLDPNTIGKLAELAEEIKKSRAVLKALKKRKGLCT